MKAPSLTEILDLPAAERIQVAQTIWESAARHPDDVEVTEAQRRQLE